MTEPRVAVIGCGGIGGTIVSHLTRAGADVTALEWWPEHVYRIREDGLTQETVSETFTTRPKILFLDEVEAGTTFDIVVVAVKGYDNAWAVPYARELLAPGGILVSTQNGLHEAGLIAAVGPEPVVGCVVAMGGELVEAGLVKATTGTERTVLVFGEMDGSASERTLLLQELFSAVGRVDVSSDISSELWGKMTLNVMSNAVAGISGLPAGDLWTNQETVDLIIGVGHEVAAVADALGQTTAPILKTITHELLLGATSPSTPEWSATADLLRAEGGRRSGKRNNSASLLQDVRKGRRTEIDYLNGLIVDLGAENGVETPLNRSIVSLVHRIERGEAKTGPEALALLTTASA